MKHKNLFASILLFVCLVKGGPLVPFSPLKPSLPVPVVKMPPVQVPVVPQVPSLMPQMPSLLPQTPLVPPMSRQNLFLKDDYIKINDINVSDVFDQKRSRDKQKEMNKEIIPPFIWINKTENQVFCKSNETVFMKMNNIEDIYEVIYECSPLTWAMNGYTIDRSKQIKGKLTKILYVLILTDKQEKTTFVAAAFLPPSQNLSDLGIPHSGSSILQTIVDDLDVVTNSPNVKAGHFDHGSIEFWPFGYGPKAKLDLPNANDETCDFDDTPDIDVKGTSMQIHNYMEQQVVMAINKPQEGEDCELGIGNNMSIPPSDDLDKKPNPDWTGTNSARLYKSAALIVAGLFEYVDNRDIKISQAKEHNEDKTMEVQKTPSLGEDYTAILPNNVNIEMLWVNPGTFMMGEEEKDAGMYDDPEHKVTLTKGYYLGKTEVTQAQYEAVMGNNPSRFKKDGSYPVENVSYNDAMAFCKKMTELERKAGRLPLDYEYSLPTEAQWEYAAKGGGKSKQYKYSGSDDLDEIAWYEKNSNASTHPVGQKRPNELGLYDMTGNVGEWCRDFSQYKKDYQNGAMEDPVGNANACVERGGCWNSGTDVSRLAFRCPLWTESGRRSCGDHSVSYGFRLALVPVLTPSSCLFADSHPETWKNDDMKLDFNGVHMILKHVSAGSFLMGSPEEEPGRIDNEKQHRVTLTKNFWMGETEVTQAQYETVMGVNPSYFKKGGDYPVEMVSWKDAMEFCKKVTEMERTAGRLPEGYEYSLPTEAQWEYAARGGESSEDYTYSGSDSLEEVGWYNDNSGSWTQPVGRLKPNELGFYDMSGNVYEWCLDGYERIDGVATATTYKDGAMDPWCRSGSEHIVRGGSWYYVARLSRIAYRDYNVTGGAERNVGFRIVLTPVKKRKHSLKIKE